MGLFRSSVEVQLFKMMSKLWFKKYFEIIVMYLWYVCVYIYIYIYFFFF